MMKTKITILSILLLSILATSAWAVRQPPGESAVDLDRDQILPCGSITPLTIGETVYGDNTGLANGANLYSCQYWDMWGGEVLYEVTITEADTYLFSVVSECDLGLMVLEDCYRMSTCLGSSDEVTDGLEWFTVALDPGTYILVVDGFWYDDGCPFEVAINDPSGPDPSLFNLGTDRCDDTPLNCLPPTFEAYEIISSTSSAFEFEADYEINDWYCLTTGHYMTRDAVFAVALNDMQMITVTLHTQHMKAYITDDCESDQCLAGMETTYSPTPSSMTYEHSGDYRLIYIVFAGYEDSFRFSYTHDGDCGLAVANETTSWGTVKSLYR